MVLTLARKEADRLRHNWVGTEHVLLGLIRLGQGTAFNVLFKMGLALNAVRTELESEAGETEEVRTTGNIHYTMHVKKALAYASREARELNHSHIGTEHILLGLLRAGEGVAARLFQRHESMPVPSAVKSSEKWIRRLCRLTKRPLRHLTLRRPGRTRPGGPAPFGISIRHRNPAA